MLHIVACIKQVPDSREIRIDPKTNTLVRQGVPAIVNYFDLHGVEEALRIKDQFGARVTVVTMGPPTAEKALSQCIAMGADEGVLVSDRAFAGADTLATSYVVALTVQKVEDTWGPVDIIFCGKQTLDGDTGQVGPGVACRLDIEQLTYVEKTEHLDINTREIVVHRHLEDGVERVKAKLPVLITALAELNQPRRASLPGVLRGIRYKPIVWTTNDFPDIDRSKIGLKGSPTIVSKTWVPEPKQVDTEFLDTSDSKAAANQLADRLYTLGSLQNSVLA
ncbi:electron transfer flavoprotein subunit beta/FixA family protein [Alicyclobacillus sp. ALC3]|uniref:electron transfer flavoprotein subunit beta/FixA family protein n=1 Tax=Alicyclobacillus sp. ALC3 TaxID=2796143 RepID=UPI002378E410|nr:electron transfer flavoprotein subunit beta/FixA family protein [Alicyclobacillus sp. ALC3]WDL99135.1 electron transfer flavoprotein subunit beta/FixA family protein [Alicyclobacillus sp. ALC3]